MDTPINSANQDFTVVPGRFWHRLGDGRIQCDLCPRFCKLREGQRGLCFVRGIQDGAMVLASYGRSSGFCVDPIEKKPLSHFLPGTPVLSFGTAGCNLACKFCQNWDMSKSREMDRLMDRASPETLAQAAVDLDCRSVAFTYNDPVIFHEYAVDTALACRERGIRTVAVSAGYVCPEPRAEFYACMDAVNIDLKAFTEDFYRRVTGGSLAPVLDTLKYIKDETETWLEITTLLVPGLNDGGNELDRMTGWIFDNLGPDVPLHFSAFHPDWKMCDVPPTLHKTLTNARRRAIENGLHYVYVGNVHDRDADSTWCLSCDDLVVGRDWYVLTDWNLADGRCGTCSAPIAGVFENTPGEWGAGRRPVRLADHSRE
jgi:pyruvate formate lyase activating enzyme